MGVEQVYDVSAKGGHATTQTIQKGGHPMPKGHSTYGSSAAVNSNLAQPLGIPKVITIQSSPALLSWTQGRLKLLWSSADHLD